MSSNSTVEYSPQEPFAGPSLTTGAAARIFGSPGRYVQGDGVLENAGYYLRRLGFSRPALLYTERCKAAEGARLVTALAAAGLVHCEILFGGECSLEEIERHVQQLRSATDRVDSVVAMGGGKVVDAGRAIAHRLGVPNAAVPTLASNDAPCAGVSVIYTAEGVTEDAEIYDENPALVLVDTGVIARADARYLVAGMGDALATWYEARSCARTPGGVNVFGARPTLAGTALAKLCADTIYEHGQAAVEAVRSSTVSEALEQVVEANTLLSGLGYESGGLSIAHAMAQGYTVIESVHSNHLHGEMVAMGIMAQLMLEDCREEAQRAGSFMAALGLPVHLGQIGLSSSATTELDQIVDAALAFPFIDNFPGGVSRPALVQAVLGADQLGLKL